MKALLTLALLICAAAPDLARAQSLYDTATDATEPGTPPAWNTAGAETRTEADSSLAGQVTPPPGSTPVQDGPLTDPPSNPARVGLKAPAWLRDLRPILILTGGLEYENVIQRKGQGVNDQRQDRIVTLAMTRFGLLGNVTRHVYVESEFEVNLGLHGTSTWEGQAALQVRNQFIRLGGQGASVQVGRITDPASVDFLSVHNLNLLGMDRYLRGPLITGGFNRGNGVGARYEFGDGLSLGLYFNAANPVSITGTAMVGGRFPPFSRFYQQAQSAVGRDANSFPDDGFHMILATPSLIYRSDWLDLNAATQLFQADTDTSRADDQTINGWNARAGVRGKFGVGNGKLQPFANGTFLRNDLLDPDAQGTVRLTDQFFEGWTASGGVDWVMQDGHGAGFQYAVVREIPGDDEVQTLSVINAAGSYYLTPSTSITARYAWRVLCIDDDCKIGGGAQSGFLTMRTLLR